MCPSVTDFGVDSSSHFPLEVRTHK